MLSGDLNKQDEKKKKKSKRGAERTGKSALIQKGNQKTAGQERKIDKERESEGEGEWNGACDQPLRPKMIVADLRCTHSGISLIEILLPHTKQYVLINPHTREGRRTRKRGQSSIDVIAISSLTIPLTLEDKNSQCAGLDWTGRATGLDTRETPNASKLLEPTQLPTRSQQSGFTLSNSEL